MNSYSFAFNPNDSLYNSNNPNQSNSLIPLNAPSQCPSNLHFVNNSYFDKDYWKTEFLSRFPYYQGQIKSRVFPSQKQNERNLKE